AELSVSGHDDSSASHSRPPIAPDTGTDREPCPLQIRDWSPPPPRRRIELSHSRTSIRRLPMTPTTVPATADSRLKAMHRQMWASGDYTRVADVVIPTLGRNLVEASGICPGD